MEQRDDLDSLDGYLLGGSLAREGTLVGNAPNRGRGSALSEFDGQALAGRSRPRVS